MASRYSTIRKAAQLAEALRNLRLYEDTPRQPKLNSRGARKPSKNIYIVPFGRDLETDEVVRVRGSVAGYTALAGQINTASTQGEVTDQVGTKTVVTVSGFRPARVVWFRNATRSVIEKKSDVTKIDYLKYNGDRDSCAFGRKVATDNQYDAFDDIKTVITSSGALVINRVTLTPERIRYN